jgi:hypothetical protein
VIYDTFIDNQKQEYSNPLFATRRYLRIDCIGFALVEYFF